MRQTVRNFVVLIVFALALTGLSLAADDTYCVRANVPFEFYAGSQLLPAGTYLFNVNYGDHAVTLRNHDTGRSYSAVAIAADGSKVSEAVVEFDVIGDTHVLADLKTASTGVNFAENKNVVKTAQRNGQVAILATLR
jgi:hypothetical protein